MLDEYVRLILLREFRRLQQTRQMAMRVPELSVFAFCSEYGVPEHQVILAMVNLWREGFLVPTAELETDPIRAGRLRITVAGVRELSRLEELYPEPPPYSAVVDLAPDDGARDPAQRLIDVAGAVPIEPAGALPVEQRSAATKYGFRSTKVVEIVGADGAATIVSVGGKEVRLTETNFVLFLRLVVALFEKANGYEPLGDEEQAGLAREDWFSGESVESQANHLRARFEPHLGGMKATAFIEISGRQVRLSTPKELVHFDRAWLLEHRNPWVRQFAARLPEQSKVRSQPV